MIPFAPQDLFARTWAAQSAPFAPHAPFIGSFHPQIPQGLISSYATTNPWIGSGYGNAFGGSTINPLTLAALQSGLVSPYATWQNAGLPLNPMGTSGFGGGFAGGFGGGFGGFGGGYGDLSALTLGARQAYLPGFYPTNYLATGNAGFPGTQFIGGGFQPPFSA